ncbi:MAG TPA: hypothetical protein VLN48_20635 [Bryobacteraceae bacterium]|nr:hypothetical protein [Bryobacteraceae bacterium]
MRIRIIATVLVLYCSTMAAQFTNYLGPGILTRGAGDIGTRAGQDVDLRFFVGATAIYDNGIQPYSVDGAGKLVTVDGLWGTEVSAGAYGVHKFRHAKLGLDYKGTYRHYANNTYFNGTDQALALGYTYQKSRRLVFDTRQVAGTVSQGTSFGGMLPTVTDALVTPSSLLFDNQANFLQSSLDVNLVKSERTVFTFGGQGFGIWRKATGLIGIEGYDLHGTVKRRLSQRTTIGANFQHAHFDYPKAFGEADLNTYSGILATQFGRYWTLSASAGAYQAEVQGLQQVAVEPEIAALLGVSSTVQTFYTKSIFPQWDLSLTRRFQRAFLSFRYAQGSSAGNGVYLTSRQETAGVVFSYSATTKWSLSLSAGSARLSGIAQGLQPYTQLTGGGDITYALTKPIHLIARYDARHQEIVDGVFKGTSYRASFGISFSPGDVPLAFH